MLEREKSTYNTRITLATDHMRIFFCLWIIFKDIPPEIKSKIRFIFCQVTSIFLNMFSSKLEIKRRGHHVCSLEIKLKYGNLHMYAFF